jgi:hypothetical protein
MPESPQLLLPYLVRRQFWFALLPIGRLFIQITLGSLRRLAFGLIVCSAAAPSFAHQTGNSYLYLQQADDQLTINLDFYVRDLGNLLQKPGAEPEPAPAPEKIQALQAEITQLIEKSLSVEVDEQPLALHFVRQTVVLHNDGLYVRQQFTASAIDPKARFVVVRYGFFTQNDKLGRAFFKLALNGDEISSVFDQATATQRFALGSTKRSATILLFSHEGAKHIWEGPDHLLFLLTLLLPGLLLWGARSPNDNQMISHQDHQASQPLAAAPILSVRQHRAAWVFALKVITAFTVAHSITLAMATLGLISLPGKLIESVIALSIMLSAILNLQQRLHINHWLLAFSFGLIHGMGFANGLKELGLSSSYFIETLIAFNVGVEFGQLSVVLLVAVPLVWLVRSDHGRERVMRWGSMTVLAISTIWFIERLMA